MNLSYLQVGGPCRFELGLIDSRYANFSRFYINFQDFTQNFWGFSTLMQCSFHNAQGFSGTKNSVTPCCNSKSVITLFYIQGQSDKDVLLYSSPFHRRPSDSHWHFTARILLDFYISQILRRQRGLQANEILLYGGTLSQLLHTGHDCSGQISGIKNVRFQNILLYYFSFQKDDVMIRFWYLHLRQMS